MKILAKEKMSPNISKFCEGRQAHPSHHTELGTMVCTMVYTDFFTSNSLKILLLQPLSWRCVECAIHHERDVREE